MSDRARNIIQLLADIGALVGDVPTERAIDEVDAMIHDDYIPGGPTATTATNLRTAPAGRRCGCRTGEDVQSGPFYCGDVATLIADTAGGCVAACAGHEFIVRRLARAGERAE